MFRAAFLSLPLLLAPVALPAPAMGADAVQSRTGENCEQQGERRRRRGRGLGGMLGGIAGGFIGGPVGTVTSVLPVGSLLGEAIASLLDCREQQQAAGATEEAVRGNVGTTATWQSETRPERHRLLDADRRGACGGRRQPVRDRHRHRHHRRRGDPRAQADVPPAAEQPLRPGLAGCAAGSHRCWRFWRSPPRRARRPSGWRWTPTTRPARPARTGRAIAQMRFTQQTVNGRPVLLAEGLIDDNMMPRLQAAVRGFQGDEIWLRSPGGNARSATRPGAILRENNMHDPHPGRLGLLLGLQLHVHGRPRPPRRSGRPVHRPHVHPYRRPRGDPLRGRARRGEYGRA